MSQDNIRWGVVMEGCLSIWWKEEQDIYMKAFKSRKSSKQWTMALIKTIDVNSLGHVATTQ